MITKYRNQSIFGVVVGLGLLSGGLILGIKDIGPKPLCALMFFGGLAVYIWGCLALAKGKGYSTAIVLTVILGILFPVVVLLSLPDKNRRHRRHHHHE